MACVQQLLLQSLPSNTWDLKALKQDGSAFLVRIQRGSPSLPRDEGLQESPFISMQTQATRVAGGVRITFSSLTRDMIHRLAIAYFDTFNFIYPFIDRQDFYFRYPYVSVAALRRSRGAGKLYLLSLKN
jgi:hypothetical protein